MEGSPDVRYAKIVSEHIQFIKIYLFKLYMTTQQYESYLPNYVDHKINSIFGGAPES
jgi:hypothetical protein